LTAGKQEHELGEKDLKVEDINDKLNELAAAASAEEKTAVLQWLVQRSSARMLKWITQIILKDLKVGFVQCSRICYLRFCGCAAYLIGSDQILVKHRGSFPAALSAM